MTETTAAPAALPSEHSAPGGAVVATGLKPREGKIVRLKCGCSSDDVRHLTFCAKVAESVGAAHRAALAAHSPNAREAATDPLLE